MSILLVGFASYVAMAWLAERALARRGRIRSRGPLGPNEFAIAAVANLAIGLVVIGEHTAIAGGTLASLGFALGARGLVTCVTLVVISGGLAASFAKLRTGTACPTSSVRGATLAVGLIALAAGAWMEEVVFRAFAFSWLAPRDAALALVVSSVVFVLVHIPTSRTDRWALLGWLGGGLSLGGIYFATHSVWVAAVAHLARNVCNVLWRDAMDIPGAPWTRTGYHAVLGATTLVVACALR